MVPLVCDKYHMSENEVKNSIDSWLAEDNERRAARKPVTYGEAYAEVERRARKAGRDRIEITEMVQWGHGIAIMYRNLWTGRYHRARLDNVVMVEEDRKYLTPAKR